MKLATIDRKLKELNAQPLNVRFQIALAEFQSNGGSYGVALAMLNAAYGKGRDAASVVPKGHWQSSVSPRTVDRGGHSTTAVKAIGSVPSRSINLPGHAKRGAIAISSVQETLAKSLFDTTKLPDGRSLREVRWCELYNLSAKYTRFAHIFTAIHNRAVPADPNATLDEIVSEKELANIFGAVEAHELTGL